MNNLLQKHGSPAAAAGGASHSNGAANSSSPDRVNSLRRPRTPKTPPIIGKPVPLPPPAQGLPRGVTMQMRARMAPGFQYLLDHDMMHPNAYGVAQTRPKDWTYLQCVSGVFMFLFVCVCVCVFPLPCLDASWMPNSESCGVYTLRECADRKCGGLQWYSSLYCPRSILRAHGPSCQDLAVTSRCMCIHSRDEPMRALVSRVHVNLPRLHVASYVPLCALSILTLEELLLTICPIGM